MARRRDTEDSDSLSYSDDSNGDEDLDQYGWYADEEERGEGDAVFF